MMIRIKDFFKDARHFQIVYLLGFLLFGIYLLNWTEYISSYIVAIAVSIVSQAVFSYWKMAEVKGLKSALITALGLCILLRVDSLYVMAVAAFVGVATKFVFRLNDKHIFNPSHIAIISVILFSSSAWVSPGQWGNEALLMFLIVASGSIVLLKVGRLDITITFLITLFALEYFRTVIYLGWEMDVLIHKFSSGSLLFFAFFMITDPRTTPDRTSTRYIWTITLAIMTFIISQWLYIYTSTIWALLLITPLTIVLDRYYPSEKYQWISSAKKEFSQSQINL